MSTCCTPPQSIFLRDEFTVALAGNPNAGKSTIFNALTGAHQHVGNWPGKTIAKKVGILKLGQQKVAIVDLPGTYSLTAYSAEEIITRDFIVDEHPDAVIAVVDAANLERNLYLVVQLLEMGAPLLIALNMTDIAESRHIQIDDKQLSKILNAPVIRTTGGAGIGISALKDTLSTFAAQNDHLYPFSQIPFTNIIEAEIACLQDYLRADAQFNQYPLRWLVIKLLENDEALLGKLKADAKLIVDQSIQRITEALGEDPDVLIADQRYEFIGKLAQAVIVRPDKEIVTTSDKIDRVLTHRIWGLPIFLMLMWLVFQLTANVSAPYVDWLEGVIQGQVRNWVLAGVGILQLDGSWVEALLIDGILTSVGGVLVFIPVLFSLYFAIAILEDSGYMARAAFVMDRFMSTLGLHGKSFLPLLVGFGCTVPAIYATRTLENESDRKITGFLATFMSCGARLPVYAVFGAAFFGRSAGNLIFGMYLLGIGVAVLSSLLITKVAFRNKPVAPFVMELPPYRIPDLKSVVIHMWERSSEFIKKAGTVILFASMMIWLLLAIPVKSGSFANVEPKDSLYGTVNQTIAPVFRPAGFGDWEASGSLMTGLVAKEVIVATMTQVYIGDTTEEEATSTTFGQDIREIATSFVDATIATIQEIGNIIPRTANLIPGVNLPLWGQADDAGDDTLLESALQNAFSPASAVAFTVFVLLYIPCTTTLGAMRQEFGARWMWGQIAYTLAVAWTASVLVFQIGQRL